jgi:hypothetical protein
MALVWQPPRFEAVVVGGECTAYAAAVPLHRRGQPADKTIETAPSTGPVSDVARTTGRTTIPRS